MATDRTFEFKNKFAMSIDDERENAELVARILERLGFYVDVLVDSQSALKRLTEENFDLVVCDIRMPDLDGRQLYRNLRQARPKSIPRIIFTSGDAADPETCLFIENNQLRLVPKPYNCEELIRQVYAEFADGS